MAEAGERVWWGNNLEDDLEEEGGGGEGRGGVAAAEPLAVARLAGAAHAQEGLRPAATGVIGVQPRGRNWPRQAPTRGGERSECPIHRGRRGA